VYHHWLSEWFAREAMVQSPSLAIAQALNYWTRLGSAVSAEGHSPRSGCAATDRAQLSSLRKGLLKSGADHALRVHRIVDRRHDAEKGMDHTGKILELDRHADAPQGIWFRDHYLRRPEDASDWRGETVVGDGADERLQPQLRPAGIAGEQCCDGREVAAGAVAMNADLVGIGAKVVSHARYVTFQMAEVAVPRQMFQEILSLTARLRAPPAPA
jgi:hypothetical protein